MLNVKIFSCAMSTAEESNHSSVDTLHIHTAMPHACTTLHCAV